MSAEEFVKAHFKGIETLTYYPAIVAIAEGYANFKLKRNTKHIHKNGKYPI